jgi:hypothetical protein
MTDDPNMLSRRNLVGAAGAGLAAAGTGAASAQGQTAATAQPMADPTTKHPKQPFQNQEQPWPGLAGKMTPKPDHGETNYKGSGRLAGKKALITGGDSGMGRAAAIAYAREGADVAINYHPDEEPDAREVIALIKEAGRKAVRCRAISGTRPSARSSSRTPSPRSAASTSWSTTPRASRRTPRSSTSRTNSSTGR